MKPYELIVIGAGPAGVAAALQASEFGIRSLIIDEEQAAGGQVYRASEVSDLPHAADKGTRLRRALAASNVACAFGRRVWMVEPGFRVASVGSDGLEIANAPALILAAGAHERVLPVEGWTLRGVIGLAAATILLKNCEVAPGRRTIVAGAGPLLPLVAHRILASGGKVAAVVDMNPLGAWFKDATSLFSRPDQLARGAIWAAKLAVAGVRYYPRHALVRVTGEERVQAAVIAPIDQQGAPVGAHSLAIPCDSICYGHGLIANLEAAKLLGAILQYHSTSGGWAIKIDQDQATSVNGLFACGDGAAIAGAAAAPYSGQIAALAVAARLGRLAKTEADRRIGRLRTKLQRAARFGQAMTRLCAPKNREVELISPSTVVCRCEAVTRATIDTAIAQGSTSLSAIKSATRCGMGPCGGRYCSDATTGLLSAAIGAHRSAIAPAFVRPPLRPVPMEALIREFRYESLSISETAPR